MKIELTDEYIRKNLEVKTIYIGNEEEDYKYRKDLRLKSPIGTIHYLPVYSYKDYDFEFMVGHVIRQEERCEPYIYN